MNELIRSTIDETQPQRVLASKASDDYNPVVCSEEANGHW